MVTTLEQDFFGVVTALDRSRIVVQEYGPVIEIVDVDKRQKVRRFRGSNVARKPSGNLIAWQTPSDAPSAQSHVLLAGVDGTGQVDLGEGAAPLFLPDNVTLMFVRYNKASERYDIVRYNLKEKRQEVQETKPNAIGATAYDLTVSPDGSATVLSAGGGRYGSAVYWLKVANGEWRLIEDNLGGWGGWSPNGLLIYATDGRDLRTLDSQRTVWGSDVRLFDGHTGKIRTIVTGTSMNEEPRWCAPSGIN